MKGIEKLHEFLKNGYNCYLSSNATEMKSYCDNIPNYKGLVKMRNDKDEKILVLAYLTTTKEIETEISVSNDFLVKDHRGAGAVNDSPCTTIFIKFQDVKFAEAMHEFASKVNKLCNI